MKKKKIFSKLLLVVLIGLTTACGSSYNTDFAPPSENASIDDVFPATIDGMERQIENIKLPAEFEGIKAFYGEKQISIDVVRITQPDQVDRFVNEFLVPEIDKLQTNFRGNINGKWYGKGTGEDGSKVYAWINSNWAFYLQAQNEELFDKAIEEFKFISK